MSAQDEKDQYIQSLLEERARAQAEKEALIAEFTNSIPAEWSPEDLKEKIRDLLAKAYARISQTIDNADEPALAFQAAKYVFQFGVGAAKITDDNDPNKELNQLLSDLVPKKDIAAQLAEKTNNGEAPSEDK